MAILQGTRPLTQKLQRTDGQGIGFANWFSPTLRLVLAMSILFVKFLLPALLGYTLFAGIANTLSLAKPRAQGNRPSWLLGLWTGLSVAVVVMTALHFAYGSALDDARALLPVAGFALALLLGTGLIITAMYRARLREFEPVHMGASAPANERIDEDADRVADRIDLFGESNPDSQELLNMTEDMTEDGHDGVSVELAERSEPELIGDDMADDTTRETAAIETMESTTTDTAPTLTDEEPTPHDSSEMAAEDLANEIELERTRREEVERHLVITRKALHRLESQERNNENHQSTIADLETELVESAQRVAAAESLAERESFSRIASENTINELREDIAKAHTDLRRSVEARARALSTANKSVDVARTANRARARVEARNTELEELLENRLETISSLIRSLEKEKRRSQDEVSSRARELILHERQLRSRRSLEEVSRSVDGNLTSRLVKKVARARPLASDS